MKTKIPTIYLPPASFPVAIRHGTDKSASLLASARATERAVRHNRRRGLCLTLLARIVAALRGQRWPRLADVRPVRGEI